MLLVVVVFAEAVWLHRPSGYNVDVCCCCSCCCSGSCCSCCSCSCCACWHCCCYCYALLDVVGTEAVWLHVLLLFVVCCLLFVAVLVVVDFVVFGYYVC